MAMNVFGDFRKQEEGALSLSIDDHKRNALSEKISIKVYGKQLEEMERELASMKKMHDRVQDVNRFILKKQRSEMGPATIDHMHATSVFLNEMINKVKSPKDFPKIIMLVEMYNDGKFNQAFGNVETASKVAEKISWFSKLLNRVKLW